MAMDRYLKMEEIEAGVLAMYQMMLKPALKRVVEDSSMPWDDAAFQIADPMIEAAIKKIHDEKASE